jgi:hypothetical protein
VGLGGVIADASMRGAMQAPAAPGAAVPPHPHDAVPGAHADGAAPRRDGHQVLHRLRRLAPAVAKFCSECGTPQG